MKVANHKLVKDNGEPITFEKSPNFGSSITPIYLIMHYTAGTTMKMAVNWFKQTQAKASAHLIIDRNGAVVQMVDFNKRAWHAGKSSWGELHGLNQYSIGIELVNGGRLIKAGDNCATWYGEKIPLNQVIEAIHKHETKLSSWHLYAEKQIAVALEVGMALHQRYSFTDILGHDDIAPGRKFDTGPAFPLESFRSKVMGRQ